MPSKAIITRPSSEIISTVSTNGNVSFSDAQVRAMSSDQLYKLETEIEEVKEAGERISNELDRRVTEWTEEDWTVRDIAAELDCALSTVHKRWKRLGIGSSRSQISESVRGANKTTKKSKKKAKKKKPKQAAEFLPDLVAEDAQDNLRTQAMRWFEQGRRVNDLLEREVKMQAQSRSDRAALKREVVLMAQITQRLRKATLNAQI